MKYPYRDFLSGLLLLHSIEFVPEFITIRDSADRIHDRKTALMVIIKSGCHLHHGAYLPLSLLFVFALYYTSFAAVCQV